MQLISHTICLTKEEADFLVSLLDDFDFFAASQIDIEGESERIKLKNALQAVLGNSNRKLRVQQFQTFNTNDEIPF